MEKGAFNQTYHGRRRLLPVAGQRRADHRELMKDAGFIAK
jgi:hypothetical protein